MFRLDELLVVSGGILRSWRQECRVESVSTDTRTLTPGACFVALSAKRDGADFLPEAYRKGALAALVQRRPSGAPRWLHANVIEVPDTLVALGDLARARRTALGTQAVAITGTCGKTSTKEILARLLARSGTVEASRGNFNNRIGLPLSLLAIRARPDWIVSEMGASEPGEICALVSILAPRVRLITNVSSAHLEGFGSLDGVYRAKLEIASAMQGGDVLVVNGEDPELVKRARDHFGNVLTFGRSEGCDVRLVEVAGSGDGFDVTVEHRACSQRARILLGSPARFQVDNFLAAVAARAALGLPLQDLATEVRLQDLPHGRFEILTPGGVTLVNDTYNANPAAFMASARAFVEFCDRSRVPGRRIVVAGTMRELAAESRALHRQVGEALASCPIDMLLGVGPHADELVQAFASANGRARAGFWVATKEEASQALASRLAPGDAVLFKASRGVALETVVDALARELAERGTQEEKIPN